MYIRYYNSWFSPKTEEIIGEKYRTKVECIDNEKGEFKVHQIFIYANKLTANLQLTISLIA